MILQGNPPWLEPSFPTNLPTAKVTSLRRAAFDRCAKGNMVPSVETNIAPENRWLEDEAFPFMRFFFLRLVESRNALFSFQIRLPFFFFSSNQNIVENFTSCQHGRKSCTCLVCESSVRWLHEQSQLAEDLLQIKPPPKKSTHMPSSTVFFQHFFLGGWDGANFGLGFFLAEKGVSKIRFAKRAPSRWTIRRSVLLGREVFVTREPGKAMGKFFFWKKSLEFLFFWDFFGLNSGWWDDGMVDAFFLLEFWLMGWFFFGVLRWTNILSTVGKICLDSR